MRQLITIGADGSLFGLDHKRKGLPLREFGTAKINRATEILWGEKQQAWHIQWCQPPKTGEMWIDRLFHHYGINYSDFNGTPQWAGIIWFADYEDAVAAEVALIQAMQTRGELG